MSLGLGDPTLSFANSPSLRSLAPAIHCSKKLSLRQADAVGRLELVSNWDPQKCHFDGKHMEPWWETNFLGLLVFIETSIKGLQALPGPQVAKPKCYLAPTLLSCKMGLLKNRVPQKKMYFFGCTWILNISNRHDFCKCWRLQEVIKYDNNYIYISTFISMYIISMYIYISYIYIYISYIYIYMSYIYIYMSYIYIYHIGTYSSNGDASHSHLLQMVNFRSHHGPRCASSVERHGTLSISSTASCAKMLWRGAQVLWWRFGEYPSFIKFLGCISFWTKHHSLKKNPFFCFGD